MKGLAEGFFNLGGEAAAAAAAAEREGVETGLRQNLH